jgi:hypothetical protein
MTIAEELHALAKRIPADGPHAVTLARQRAAGAVETVTAALSTDPTVAERQQRWLDVLAELLRRLTPLARQTLVAIESGRLAAAGASTAHLGRTNLLAAEELGAVSARCTELACQAAAAVWHDWNTPAAGASCPPAGCQTSTNSPRSPTGSAAQSRRPWILPTRTRKQSGSRSSPTR